MISVISFPTGERGGILFLYPTSSFMSFRTANSVPILTIQPCFLILVTSYRTAILPTLLSDATMSLNPMSASLTTVTKLTDTCGSHLRSVLKTDPTSIPDEILALSNEISDLSIVLNEVEANHEAVVRSIVTTEQVGRTDFWTSDLIQRAHSKLVELNNLVSRSIEEGRQNEGITRRGFWRQKKNLSKASLLMQDLRDMKQNIMLMLASKNVYVSLPSVRRCHVKEYFLYQYIFGESF